MNKKPNIKHQDTETSRSILKSNSPRPIRNSTPSTKASNGQGIFKRASLNEPKSVTDVMSTSIRITRSDSVAQDMDHFKGIIKTKSPDKQAKKVKFLDSTTRSDDNNGNQFCAKTDDDSEFHILLKSSLGQIIDDKTDNILDLLSVIPTEISPRNDTLRNNINSLSKMTSMERIFVILSIILFFIMILKHFRFDWVLPSTGKPQLTGSEIIKLIGSNVKRICKNLVSLQ